MTPQSHAAVSVATFVPNTAPITIGDYLALHRLAEELIAVLAALKLNVRESIGIDCAEVGMLREGLMRFEVRDRASAVEAIQQALAQAGIPREHFEIVSRPADVLAPYETNGCPPGRKASLHGLTDHELLLAMATHATILKPLLTSQLEELQAVISSLQKVVLLVN